MPSPQPSLLQTTHGPVFPVPVTTNHLESIASTHGLHTPQFHQLPSICVIERRPILFCHLQIALKDIFYLFAFILIKVTRVPGVWCLIQLENQLTMPAAIQPPIPPLLAPRPTPQMQLFFHLAATYLQIPK